MPSRTAIRFCPISTICAPYRQASLDAWLAKIDEQIATHSKRNFG
jgi:hypothetical protein